jgi:hypothetical protein
MERKEGSVATYFDYTIGTDLRNHFSKTNRPMPI